MKKYKIIYMGASRDTTEIALESEEISEEKYLKLTDQEMEDYETTAQELAEEYFEVGGWVEIKEINGN